jgi:hypothetical protein
VPEFVSLFLLHITLPAEQLVSSRHGRLRHKTCNRGQGQKKKQQSWERPDRCHAWAQRFWPVQMPSMHESIAVPALPSSQEVPSGSGWPATQLPRAHVDGPWHLQGKKKKKKEPSKKK